jgi:hypothetical protein
MNQQAPQGSVLPVSTLVQSATEQLILNGVTGPGALLIGVPPDTGLEQAVFDLFASGIITTTNTTSVDIRLYEGTAINAGKLLGSTGVVPQPGTVPSPVTEAWYLHARLIYDSISGVLAGTVDGYVNKTMVAAAVLANFVGGFRNAGNPSANPPTYPNLPVFCLSASSSAAAFGTPTTVVVQKFSVG